MSCLVVCYTLFSYIACPATCLPSRVKAYISNGWDKRIVDPDPNRLYTHRRAVVEQQKGSADDVPQEEDVGD